MDVPPFQIGTELVEAGTRRTVNLPVSVLSNHTPMTLPVHVVHGAVKGPVMFVSGAVHGDELLGVEVVRRLLGHLALNHIAGTLLAIPIVNAFGFIGQSRYMPDGRDLNRSFPGSDRGSLASILADLFSREVLLRSHYGIDLHSAGRHRMNLPQIRIAPNEPELLDLAEAFGAPVILISKLREGSLRQFARERKVQVLLYEAGEALRIDQISVRAGVLGILRVMKKLDMIASPHVRLSAEPPALSRASSWLRAPEGGIFRAKYLSGEFISPDQPIGQISDPFGENVTRIYAPQPGIIIGHSNLPVVNRGDALFHIARVDDAALTRDRIARIGDEIEAATVFDEDEI